MFQEFEIFEKVLANPILAGLLVSSGKSRIITEADFSDLCNFIGHSCTRFPSSCSFLYYVLWGSIVAWKFFNSIIRLLMRICMFSTISLKKKKREIEMVVWDNFPWLSAGLNYTSSDASALLQLWILSCQWRSYELFFL